MKFQKSERPWHPNPPCEVVQDPGHLCYIFHLSIRNAWRAHACVRLFLSEYTTLRLADCSILWQCTVHEVRTDGVGGTLRYGCKGRVLEHMRNQ